jgi:membrane protein DedA with SNARE-associated domain
MHVILIYIGIFCGIFYEGEMVIITSVIAAHHGHLNLSFSDISHTCIFILFSVSRIILPMAT